jgi:hypothetical protein
VRPGGATVAAAAAIFAVAAFGEVGGVCELATIYTRTPPAIVMKREFIHLLKFLP